MTITADAMLRRFLDTNGDGSGTKNANGNYSSAEEIFYIQPPAHQNYLLYRMMAYVKDSGTFDSGSYGNGITLTNGIAVRVSDDSGVQHDLTDGVPVKTNPDWRQHCFDAEPSSYGLGDEALGVRWTFTRGGPPILLEGANGDRLEVVLHDDFSGLITHTFKVEGVIE